MKNRTIKASVAGFLLSGSLLFSIHTSPAHAALRDCSDINLNSFKDPNGKPLFEFVSLRYHMNHWSCVWSTSTGNAGIMIKDNVVHNGTSAFITKSSLPTPGVQTSFGYQAPGWMLAKGNNQVSFTITAHSKAQCEAIARDVEKRW